MENEKKNILLRLNRIKGQIDGIIRMIENGEDCQVIYQQVKAAYNALKSAGKMLIVNDIFKCISTEENEKKLKNLLEKLMEE